MVNVISSPGRGADCFIEPLIDFIYFWLEFFCAAL